MSSPAGRRRGVFAWALYDWANSAFATTVMAGFFPLFFKQYWNAGVEATVSTFRLGVANSAAGVLVALAAPVLGAIADRGGGRKRSLGLFLSLGVVCTGALYGVSQGGWVAAAVLYGAAVVGFSGANIFYDALLVEVAAADQFDWVSALGFSLGYLGGGVLFAFNVALTLWPGAFGLADAAAAVRVSFLSVAVWWGLFSVPLFTRVPERVRRGSTAGLVGQGFRQLATTFHGVRRLKVTFTFLLAYWIYIDGVDTIVRMAVDFGLSIGLDHKSLITALLLVQFVGFPAALVFGRLGQRIGAKRGILLGLAVYLGVTVWGAFLDSAAEFYGLAVAIGLVQGGVQALSRSLFARMVPTSRSAEFFGFYNMMGKFAAVVGPLLMGWVGLLTGSSRASILAVAVLFLVGGGLLLTVDEEAGRRAALALDAER
ncbi:MAG: MFS transporter [Deferrisomatales bacterium]|nr:MFS transporter [Deferrisomatales bacterium]